MNPLTKYLVTALILTCLGAGAYGLWSYHAMTERVASLEQTATEYASLKQQFDAFSKEVVYRRDLDNTVRSNRARVITEVEKTSREDKPTSDFLAAPIPYGLRAAYQRAKEQRLPDPHRD